MIINSGFPIKVQKNNNKYINFIHKRKVKIPRLNLYIYLVSLCEFKLVFFVAILSIPEHKIEIRDPKLIRAFFEKRGIFFDQWKCDVEFDDNASQEEILAAYKEELKLFMEQGAYQTADVISINHLTENYEAIRAKFLAEHTHSEDEIRFFVDGQGLFWFNLETEEVFNLLCQKGDLISVPAGTKHWFDAGEKNPFVKTIRIFIDASGWTPIYTEANTEKQFSNFVMPK